MGKKNYVKLIPRYLKDKQCKWIDRDNLMMHYMFECLCEYMEHEFSSLADRYSGIDEECKELVELYEWWTKELPMLEEEDGKWKKDLSLGVLGCYKKGEKYKWYDVDYVTDEPFFDKKDYELYSHMTWQEFQEKEMLQRLLNIRKMLWT